MESKNGKSVILTEDGTFRTVKGNYSVGWEFDYKVPLSSNRKMTSRIAAAAACLFMMMSMGVYSYQNLMVYATVTLHGTAPIQLELNRHDKVIGVRAIDESGEALAEQLLDSGIRGEYLEDAVAKAEKVMQAQKDGDSPRALLPQVQCKSSDKLKVLTDRLRKSETSPSSRQAAPSKETSGTTTTAPAATEKVDISAQETEKTEESTAAETSTTTQPSSSEEKLSGQEGQQTTEDMTLQEETTEATDMTAQEAVEIPQTTDAPAAADTAEGQAAEDAAETGAAADKPAPAEDPVDEAADGGEAE